MAIVELPDLTTLTDIKLEDCDDNYSSSSSYEDYDSSDSNESKSYTSGTSEKDYEDIIASLREDIHKRDTDIIEARRENDELTRIYSSLISDSVKKIGDLTSMISDYAYYKSLLRCKLCLENASSDLVSLLCGHVMCGSW